jgi:hypothetical protein
VAVLLSTRLSVLPGHFLRILGNRFPTATKLDRSAVLVLGVLRLHSEDNKCKITFLRLRQQGRKIQFSVPNRCSNDILKPFYLFLL